MASYFDQVNGLAPKVWYRFNETAGSPVNSGSLTTTASFVSLLLNEESDVDGRSVYFDGSAAYVSLNAWPSFSLFNDKSFTVETWFKSVSPFQGHLFSFSGANGTSNRLRVQLMPSGDPNQFKLQLDFAGLGEQVADRTTYSTNTYNDNMWHHVVVAVNTTSLKWYIDGQLIATKALTTGTLDWDNYSTSAPNFHRIIGSSKSFVSGNLSTTKFRGRIDEFALYGFELTAQNVLDNFNAGASVQFADIPGTASSLAVMPAFSTECVQLPAPMTASSLFVDTYVSNFDYVDGVQKIIEDLSPHQWIKFDATTDVTRNTPTGFLKNYGSGGSPVFSSYAVGDAYQQVGPAQETRLELRLGSGTGALVPGFATTTTSAFFTDEVSDNNFSIGIWFKMPTGIDTSEKQIFSYSGGTNSAIGLRVNNKKVVFTLQTSHTTYTHTETNDISENEWHLAVIRLDLTNTTLKYYLDGTEVYSDTAIQGTRNTPTTFQFGKNTTNGTDTTTKFQQISHFFVTTYAAGTATVIDNLWDAGTRQNQAKGVMTFPILKFDNKYDQVVASLNPIQQVGFNDISGTVLENVGSNINTPFNLIGTNYVRGTSVPTKNRYGYNFTNKNTYVAGAFSVGTNTYSDNTQTISVYAKIPAVTGSDNQIIVIYGAGNFNGTGIGLSIMANASGPYLAIIPTTNPANTYSLSSGSTSWYGDWHLYTAVRDGTTTRFYIDGEQVASGTYSAYNFTDTGQAAIGGGETVWLGQAAATVDKYIDEFAAFDYALSAQQITEMYQAIEIDRMNATNATFPMPTNIAGTGNTQTPAPMTASSESVQPVLTAETNELAIAMDAFAEFILPNFGGNVVIDTNYGHTAATADAVFHDPQFQIGDFHTADHMDASALFVHPISTGGGRITVSTAVGGPATFVMPGIVTIKGARVFAEPARANAALPLPPAYVQLTDDNWFNLLLAGHAERIIEPVQSQIISATQSTTDVAQGGFLSFFDDLLADRTPTTTTNTVSSEIPAFYFKRAEAYSYDNNGNLIAPDTTKAAARLNAARASSDPTAILGSGTFDPYERKAARFNNIELPLPGTDIYYSQRPYNIEFSFKSTKQDQIVAYGKWNSFNGYARNIGVIGLADGKIYLAEDAYKVFSPDPIVGLSDYRANIPATAPHPKNFVNRAEYLLGRKNIADGQWHHVIIQQGWTDGRTQIWIDGELDRQIGVTAETGGGYSTFPGSDGTNTIRPYIIGFNSDDDLLYSDFETSAFNFYPARFITQDKILANFAAYSKWKPVKAEPMTATVRMTDKNAAKGNRPRALLLYWWESGDNGKYGYWDEPTFPLDTRDVKGEPPQQYYGWDIFPIDVIGKNKSEMLKENVWVGNGYRDSVSGSPRYLDLINDLDISQFDAIFFKNYPEQTEELDEYTRTEISDTYFGTQEKTLHENFLESLRKAMDTGISLFVTNAQLALDLGIVDRVERISDLAENEFDATDTFVVNKFANISSQSVIPTTGLWTDTWRNNRLRVVNTYEDITNYPTYLWRDWMLFTNDDSLSFGEIDRPYISLLDRPNGLQVGDEFIISDAYTYGLEYEAVPFANVKAGTIITAFANTVDRNGVAIENPYRNYATSIAVAPGTILKGRPTVGKIFVNFTERIDATVSKITGAVRAPFIRPHWESRDSHRVELIQDKWINQAYADGSITLEKRNELLASLNNLDRRLEAAIAANNQSLINYINALKYWDFNGENIIANKSIINDPTGAGTEKDNLGDGIRKTIVNKTSRKGVVSTRTVSSTAQWFQITWAYEYDTLQVKAPSLLSNGFSWLADKVVDDGTVNRVEAMRVTTATLPMPTTVGDKDRTVYVQAMVANATIIHAPGYALADVSNTTLPLTANAGFGEFVKNIKPDVFLATATFRQNVRTTGIEEDEIVVYMIHVDPILYIREEIIK